MAPLSFKKCASCGVNLPEADKHSQCLICLGESHIRSQCDICKGFSSRVQRTRDSKLKALLYDQALAPEELRQTINLPLQPSTQGDRPPSQADSRGSALGAATEPPRKKSKNPKSRPKSKPQGNQTGSKKGLLTGDEPLSPPVLYSSEPIQLQIEGEFSGVENPPTLLPIELLSNNAGSNDPYLPGSPPSPPLAQEPPLTSSPEPEHLIQAAPPRAARSAIPSLRRRSPSPSHASRPRSRSRSPLKDPPRHVDHAPPQYPYDYPYMYPPPFPSIQDFIRRTHTTLFPQNHHTTGNLTHLPPWEPHPRRYRRILPTHLQLLPLSLSPRMRFLTWMTLMRLPQPPFPQKPILKYYSQKILKISLHY